MLYLLMLSHSLRRRSTANVTNNWAAGRVGGVVPLVPETTQIKLEKVHKKLVRSNGPGLLQTKEGKK